MHIIKKGLLFIIITYVFCSCTPEQNNSRETKQEVTTFSINQKDSLQLDSKPLVIIYHSNYLWGVPVSKEDNMLMNFIKISQMCEEELGFQVKFREYSGKTEEENAFRTFVKAGLEADLIFPSSVKPSTIIMKNKYFWGDQYIEDGIYTDLTPHLWLCPEALLNFERYPYVKDMCTKNGKVYAVYVGMPRVSTLALLVRNDLLAHTETNIINLNNFDTIYNFMYELYPEEPPDDLKKILINSPKSLMQYAIFNSEYYPLFLSKDLLLNTSDDNYVANLIEDTPVLDYFMEKFSPFLIRSYFCYDNEYFNNVFNGSQDMYLTNVPLRDIKLFAREHNIFRNYSIVLLNDQKPVIDCYDSILPVMVPTTSTQPEKAMVFMQWLMTNDDVVDLLTFGSQIMNMNHYVFSDDGTIMPEKYNTIYAFCHLIANFSDKAFLFGNKGFDIIGQYQALTQEAVYPDFYKMVESQHNHYSYSVESFQNTHIMQSKREKLLNDAIIEWIKEPDTLSAFDSLYDEISQLADTKIIIDEATKYIRKILESGETIYVD